MRYVDACELDLWHLTIWHPDRPEEVRKVPYRCRSWRHTGDCCLWKGAQDWVRVKEAVNKRDDWVYVVLTYDPKDWPNWLDQYRESKSIWQVMQKRLIRKYGPLAYIQTWERHLKGGLHVNLLLGNAKIKKEVRCDWRAWRKSVLEPMAVASGYGRRTWVQEFQSGTAKAMAGYLTKLARELVGAGGKGQIPFDAPKHFRRLRASRGLLPPVARSDMTGFLALMPLPGEKRG